MRNRYYCEVWHSAPAGQGIPDVMGVFNKKEFNEIKEKFGEPNYSKKNVRMWF